MKLIFVKIKKKNSFNPLRYQILFVFPPRTGKMEVKPAPGGSSKTVLPTQNN